MLAVIVSTLGYLRTTEGASNGATVVSSGYATIDDGGGGKWVWKAGSSEPDDIGLVVQAGEAPGRWHRLHDGTVSVRWFGAKGDGVTDDAQAIQAAIEARAFGEIRDEYATSYEVHIPATEDGYFINSDVVISRNIILRALAGTGRGGSTAKLIVGECCDAGIWVRHPGGVSAPPTYQPEDNHGSGRSSLYGIVLECQKPGSVDYGFIYNNTVNFYECEARRFKKAGFFAHGQSSGNEEYGDPNGSGGSGTMFGNTNGSNHYRCLSSDTTDGHGFAAQGNNTQIMGYYTCDASGNKGAGFLDNSSIGCNYYNGHTASNTFRVQHNGDVYASIKQHTSGAESEPGIGEDWRVYWADGVNGAAEETWQSGKFYRASGGINQVETGGSSTSVYGHYSEGGAEVGVVLRASGSLYGGEVAGLGRIHDHPEANGVHVYGSTSKNTPPRWKGINPETGVQFGSALGSNRDVATFFSCGHDDDPDSTVPGARGIILKYSGNQHAYETRKGPSTTIQSVPTENWSKDGYAGSGYVYFNPGVLIGGEDTVRVRSAASLGAIPNGITVVQGERWLLTGATASAEFTEAYCSVGGVTGTDAVFVGINPIP